MKEEIISKNEFIIDNKKVTVYPSAISNRPIIYLNTFDKSGLAVSDSCSMSESVYRKLRSSYCFDFNFVVISGLDWEHDMSPWNIPPISKNIINCTGGADKYLHLLTKSIIPKAEEYMHGNVLWRGLAGYSLAGLFAVYSIYKTELFSRIASVSGSFWFPAFKDYVFSHGMISKPDYIYFSIGDKEAGTKNQYLKSVQANTEEIEVFYKSCGINTTFELNIGGHNKGVAERITTGLAWILKA